MNATLGGEGERYLQLRTVMERLIIKTTKDGLTASFQPLLKPAEMSIPETPDNG
jgi:hypothetical protein